MRTLFGFVILFIFATAQPAQAYSPTLNAMEAAVSLALGFSLPDEFNPAVLQRKLCDKSKTNRAACIQASDDFQNKRSEILTYLEMAKEAEIVGSRALFDETLAKLSFALTAYRTNMRQWYVANVGPIDDIPIPPLRPNK